MRIQFSYSLLPTETIMNWLDPQSDPLHQLFFTLSIPEKNIYQLIYQEKQHYIFYIKSDFFRPSSEPDSPSTNLSFQLIICSTFISGTQLVVSETEAWFSFQWNKRRSYYRLNDKWGVSLDAVTQVHLLHTIVHSVLCKTHVTGKDRLLWESITHSFSSLK